MNDPSAVAAAMSSMLLFHALMDFSAVVMIALALERFQRVHAIIAKDFRRIYYTLRPWSAASSRHRPNLKRMVP